MAEHVGDPTSDRTYSGLVGSAKFEVEYHEIPDNATSQRSAGSVLVASSSE